MAYFKIVCGGGSNSKVETKEKDYEPPCRPDLLKIIHPKPTKICKVNRSCCPFSDGAVKFPVCSWFASPTYSYTCWRVRQSCCGVKCLYSDERKHRCTNNKPGTELGSKLSSNTLHGVRSVNDLRAWSMCCEERRRYFQEQMLSLSDGRPDEGLRETEQGFLNTGADPVEARYESLLSRKDDEIERLKQQLLELERLKSKPPPKAPARGPSEKSVAKSPAPGPSGQAAGSLPQQANAKPGGESQKDSGGTSKPTSAPPPAPATAGQPTPPPARPTGAPTQGESSGSSTSSTGPQGKKPEPGKDPKKPGNEDVSPEDMSRGLFGSLGDTDNEGTPGGSGRSSGSGPGGSNSPNNGGSPADESWHTASEGGDSPGSEARGKDSPSPNNKDGSSPQSNDKKPSPADGGKGSPKDATPGKGTKGSPENNQPGGPKDDPSSPKKGQGPSSAGEKPVEIEFSLSFDSGDGSHRPGIMKILKIKDGRVIEEMDPGRNNGAQLLSLSCNDDNTCEAEISSDMPEPSMFTDENGEVSFEIELPSAMDDYPYDYPSGAYPPSGPMTSSSPLGVEPEWDEGATDAMNNATDTIYRLHQTINRLNDRARNQARSLQQRNQDMGGGMGDRLIQVERYGGPQY